MAASRLLRWLPADSRDGRSSFHHIHIKLLTSPPKNMAMLIVYLDFHKKLILSLKKFILLSQ